VLGHFAPWKSALTDPEEGEDAARSIYWWFSTSQFVLPFGNTYWADGLGRIHSS
jgi:hypothetical protein